jgi:hypothetical protein
VAIKRKQCAKYRCTEEPCLGGLCKKHYEESIKKEIRRNAALSALHKAEIEGRLPDNPALREELFLIRKWWFRACDSLNYGRKDEILLDEAEYAIEWCIALAQEIVDAEIASRNKQPIPDSLEYTKDWVWERFSNLEKGLMSNGIEHPNNN